jgi:hypothetical protein
MNVFGQLLHVEELRRGDVLYRIAVFRVQGGLGGKWSCSVCNDDAQTPCLAPTIEGCTKAVKWEIEQHHAERHVAAATDP